MARKSIKRNRDKINYKKMIFPVELKILKEFKQGLLQQMFV